MNKLLSCDLHDHFEIICMRQSHVKITTLDSIYQGVAADIVVQDKQEYLKLHLGNSIELICLTDIAKLEALSNPIAEHNFVLEIENH